MEKKILVNDNYIRIDVQNGYCSECIHIAKAFIKNNLFYKSITFNIWDDMSFNAHVRNSELYSNVKDITFEIEIDDLIYFSLNRMLGKDNILVIDDDDTSEELKNYIEFKRIANKIIINFHDEDIDKPLFDRFKVFVKNIVSDNRSKIDDFNIKYRLVKFFREAKEILLNENHQYSLDEYFEILKSMGIYNGLNPFLSRTNRWYRNPCEGCFNCLNNCGNNKSMDIWCENYLPDKVNFYDNLMRLHHEGDNCCNCEYSISSELFDSIVSENDRFKDMSLEELYKEIGYCELFDTIDIPKKLGYWCPSYMEKND